MGDSWEEEEWPLGSFDDDTVLEDELQFFHGLDNEEAPDHEYMVGSFDADDVVDNFLLGQLDGRSANEEVALGDIFDLYDSEDDDSYDIDDEDMVGAGEFDDLDSFFNEIDQEYKNTDDSSETALVEDEVSANDDEEEEQVGLDIYEILNDVWESDSSDMDSSEEAVGDYFVMEHTAPSSDEEVAIGKDDSENIDEEKPVEVGDSFFDIDDDKLEKDLVSQFKLEDSDEIDLTEPSLENHKEHMIGISVNPVSMKPIYWTDTSFYAAVGLCALVLVGVIVHIAWTSQDKGDDFDNYFVEFEDQD